MTDINELLDLRRRAEAAREFEHRLSNQDGRDLLFCVRTPTRYDMSRLVALAGTDEIAAMRNVVAASVVGWSGVQFRDAFPESKTGAEPLAYSAEALALVLDEQVKWLLELWNAILDHAGRRAAKLEADRKNSPPESSTTAPAPGPESSGSSDSAH